MRHIDSPAYGSELRERIEQAEADGISDFDAYIRERARGQRAASSDAAVESGRDLRRRLFNTDPWLPEDVR